MEFKLPDIHEINVLVDGQRFDGCWYIILNEMIVWYNGYTASTHQRKTDADEVAVTLLGELVTKHHVPLEAIPSTLPHAMRLAAHSYVNSFDDEDTTAELVSSFDVAVIGSAGHQQLSWLCVNALSMVVPAWKQMCDGNAAEDTFNNLRQWLHHPRHAVDWQAAVTPAVALRNGVRIGDCDACRLEPIADAVTSTARYLQSAQPADATATLLSVEGAYSEGCHSPAAPDRFVTWLVFDVLPVSLERKSLKEGA